MTISVCTRRNFLKAMGATTASLAMSSCALARERTAHRPNIVMILVDDLGYGDLSSYGAMDMKTPNIDKLIASGMRFNNFYANCPVCSPTRASLLSGRYPDLVGVPGVVRTAVERHTVGDGKIGTMTKKLLKYFDEFVKENCKPKEK